MLTVLIIILSLIELLNVRSYIVERDLLLSAFIVRTLFEAGKLSDEMADYELSIVSYPATPWNTNKLMPLLRRVPDDDLYDYGRPSQLSVPGRRFVNQADSCCCYSVF